MDTVTPSKRSEIMSHIRSKNTTPEVVIRSFLHQRGFRFRLHEKKLPGSPDIVLPKYKTVVEIRGCFWHQHQGCKIANRPLSNVDFWNRKFERNVARDKKNEVAINNLGWNLIVIWECQVRDKTILDRLPARIKAGIFKTQRQTLNVKIELSNPLAE